MWKYTGTKRPGFAVAPGDGQESVWDYPRPPVVAPCSSLVEVRDRQTVIARTRASLRVLETASPPSYYLPVDDIRTELLADSDGSSICEWKGAARYRALARNPGVPIAWEYAHPRSRFDVLTDHLSFYPGRIACYVDDERVEAQPGFFYGGWITSSVVGPFKGEAGTGHW